MALFTIVLPVLLGAMALGTDFAIIYLNWSMVQKAADAAALAGASQLTAVPGSAASLTPAVDNYVNGYACLNGVSDPSNTYATICPTEASHPGGVADKIAFTTVTDTQVSVGIHRTVPYSFGKMIGLNTAAVAAKATAAIEATGTVPGGLVPIGLQCTPSGTSRLCDVANLFTAQNIVTFGAKFVLNDSNNNLQASGGAPGNWGWVILARETERLCSEPHYRMERLEQFQHRQTITSDPGDKGNYRRAEGHKTGSMPDWRHALQFVPKPSTRAQRSASRCQWYGNTSAAHCNDPCLITVPAVDFTGCNGNCTIDNRRLCADVSGAGKYHRGD